MNKVQFKLHRMIFGDKSIDRGVLDYLYNNYVEYNKRLELESSLMEEEFKSVISTIYSVLSLRMNDEEFLYSINRFILYMLKDQLDGNKVDVRWIVDHIKYLSVCRKDFDFMDIRYRQSIEVVRGCLIEKFDLKEEYKTKKKIR